MDGTCREMIKTGQQVLIVLKKDQRSGVLTRGIVKDILTRSPTHPTGSRSASKAARSAGQTIT